MAQLSRCGVVIWVVSLASLSASSEEIREIERLKISLSRLNKIQWTARERTIITRIPDKAGYTKDKWMRVSRDVDRWTALTKETGDVWSDAALGAYSTCREVVFANRQVLQINDEREMRRRVDDPRSVPLPADGKSMRLFGALDGEPPSKDAMPHTYLDSGKVFFGYLDAFTFLTDALSGGQLIAGRPNPELADAVAITNRSEFGMCKVWLAPRFGFLPQRVELMKTGRDRFGKGVTIDSARRARPGKIWPTSQLKEYRQVVDNVTFATFNGVPVLQAYSDTQTYAYADGQELTLRHEFRIEEFKLPGPDAFAPTIKIPSGTPVEVSRAPNLRYAWHDGRIEPDTDVRVLRELELAKHELHGSHSTRFILIGLNAFVIATLTIWIILRRLGSA